MTYRKRGESCKKVLPYPQKAYIILAVVRDTSKTEQAVKTAYEAGFSNGRKQGIQMGIEMGIQHAGEVMSAELHRFKFPEGHEARWQYKVDSLRPEDNSTFEFTYQTYEERVKEKEAAARRVRAKRRVRMNRK